MMQRDLWLKHRTTIVELGESLGAYDIRACATVDDGFSESSSGITLVARFHRGCTLMDVNRLTVEIENILGVEVDLFVDERW